MTVPPPPFTILSSKQRQVIDKALTRKVIDKALTRKDEQKKHIQTLEDAMIEAKDRGKCREIVHTQA